MDGKFKLEAFVEKGPIVGILRGNSLTEAEFIAECYVEAGLYALEVTMNTEGVETIISTLTKKYHQLTIGAGTVCNVADLSRAADCGAQFIVTPVIDEKVIKKSCDLHIPIFPGAYTPTEIYKAWSLGATAVKIFPATLLGPQYVKDVLAPLNTVKLLPTGGVSKANINSFRKAGAFGVGMGSSLIDKKMLATKDKAGLVRHLSEIKKSWY